METADDGEQGLTRHFKSLSQFGRQSWRTMVFRDRKDSSRVIGTSEWPGIVQDATANLVALNLEEEYADLFPSKASKAERTGRTPQDDEASGPGNMAKDSFTSREPGSALYDQAAQKYGTARNVLDPSLNGFSLFAWLSIGEASTAPTQKGSQSNISSWCQEVLESCHTSLNQSQKATSFQDQSGVTRNLESDYQSCSTARYSQIADYLELERTSIERFKAHVQQWADGDQLVFADEADTLVEELRSQFPRLKGRSRSISRKSPPRRVNIRINRSSRSPPSSVPSEDESQHPEDHEEPHEVADDHGDDASDAIASSVMFQEKHASLDAVEEGSSTSNDHPPLAPEAPRITEAKQYQQAAERQSQLMAENAKVEVEVPESEHFHEGTTKSTASAKVGSHLARSDTLSEARPARSHVQSSVSGVGKASGVSAASKGSTVRFDLPEDHSEVVSEDEAAKKVNLQDLFKIAKAAETILDQLFEFVSCAKAICHFFISPDTDAIVVEKFWGAVQLRIDQAVNKKNITAYEVSA